MQIREIAEASHTSLTVNDRLPINSRSLLAGEDAAAYEQLLARFSAVVRPADIIEEMWVQDVVDLSWEVTRLRRLKDELLTSNAHYGLRKVLDSLMGWKVSQDLTARWAAKQPDAVVEVEQILAAANMTETTVMANTLAVLIDEVERIDRLTAAGEGRRNATLREIGNHRSTFAAALRRATDEIEVTEFEVLPPTSAPAKSEVQ